MRIGVEEKKVEKKQNNATEEACWHSNNARMKFMNRFMSVNIVYRAEGNDEVQKSTKVRNRTKRRAPPRRRLKEELKEILNTYSDSSLGFTMGLEHDFTFTLASSRLIIKHLASQHSATRREEFLR